MLWLGRLRESAARGMTQVAEAGLTLLVQEMVAQFAPQEGGEGGDAPAERDYSKLERVGFQVGVRVVERLTLEKPRFSDGLEAVKFICKDFWTAVFKKQVDNLKTNHKVHHRQHLEGELACVLLPALGWFNGWKLTDLARLCVAGRLRPDGQQLSVD